MKIDDFIDPVKGLFSGRLAQKANFITDEGLLKIALKAAAVAFGVGLLASYVTGSVLVFAVTTPIAFVLSGSYYLHHAIPFEEFFKAFGVVPDENCRVRLEKILERANANVVSPKAGDLFNPKKKPAFSYKDYPDYEESNPFWGWMK